MRACCDFCCQGSRLVRILVDTEAEGVRRKEERDKKLLTFFKEGGRAKINTVSCIIIIIFSLSLCCAPASLVSLCAADNSLSGNQMLIKRKLHLIGESKTGKKHPENLPRGAATREGRRSGRKMDRKEIAGRGVGEGGGAHEKIWMLRPGDKANQRNKHICMHGLIWLRSEHKHVLSPGRHEEPWKRPKIIIFF